MKSPNELNPNNSAYGQYRNGIIFKIFQNCLAVIVAFVLVASLSLVEAVAIDVPAPPAGRQAKIKTVIVKNDEYSSGGRLLREKGWIDFRYTDMIDPGAGYDPDGPQPVGFVVSSAGSGATFHHAVWSNGSLFDFSFLGHPGSNYSQDAIIAVEPPRKHDFQNYIDNGPGELVLAEGRYFENAVITHDITIRGQGIGRTIVSGGLLGSVFRIVGNVTVRLEDMTIIDGLAYDENNNRTGSGGGIYNFGGNVTVVRCEIKNNIAFGAAGEGGAIFNRGGGTLRLVDSLVRNNKAGRNGGGISNSGLNTSLLPALGNAVQSPAQGLRDFFTSVSQLQFASIDISAPTQDDQDAAAEVIENLVFGVVDTFRDAAQFLGDAIDAPFAPDDFWTTYGLPKMVISNSTIEGNKVDPVFLGFGGGVHNDLGLVKIEDSIIQLNKSSTNLGSFGGGISSFVGALKISDSRIIDNEVTASTPLASGGAIHSFASFVQIADSDMNDNLVNALVLESGGGLKNTVVSITSIDRSSINGNNSGGGGGISNDYLSFLWVDNSTISDNAVAGLIEGNGGGLRNENGGQVLITNSTLDNNTGKGKTHGGGLYNHAKSRTATEVNEETGQEEFVVKLYVASTVTLFNTTISGNTLDGLGEFNLPGDVQFNIPLEALGAGIYNGTDKRGLALVNCLNCTIVDNHADGGLIDAGGGLYNTPATKFVEFDKSKLKPKLDPTLGYSAITLGNTLIGDNSPNDTVSTSLIVSLGYNLDSDGTAAFFAFPTDGLLPPDAQFRTESNLFLSPLQFNGGRTKTHALLNGSPALDTGFPGISLQVPATVIVEDQPIDLNEIQVGDTTLAALINGALVPFNVKDQRGASRADGGTRWDIGAFESILPSGTVDSYETLEDIMLTVSADEGVLANDIGDLLTAQLIDAATHGTVTLAADGSFTYMPDPDYLGPDSFTYAYTDNRARTGGPVTVDLTVRPALDVLDVSYSATSSYPGVSTVTITFDGPVDGCGIINSIRLIGSFGEYAAISCPEFTGNQAVLHFFAASLPPGEQITVVLDSSIESTAGAPLFPGFIYQFVVGTGGGDGLFRPGSTLDQSFKSEFVLADIDRDGDLDAVAAGNGASVYVNDGTGVFSASGQQFGGSGVAVGNLDGDFAPDVFVVSGNSGAVWFGTGNGDFTKTSQTISSGGKGVALGDVDGDGDLDAFIARGGPNQVWLNNGGGQFADSGQQLGDRNSLQVRLADLDGDGDLDAFVANGGGGADAVWLNDGFGNFSSTQLVGNQSSSGVALGDVDNDGDIDALVAAFGEGATILWLNDGSGSFSMGQSPAGGGDNAEGVALGDLNADGYLDAFFADAARNAIWLNDGNGSFIDSGQELVSDGKGVVLGDLDGDGDLDALVTGQDNFDVDTFSTVPGAHRVWLNLEQPTVAAPTYPVEEDLVLTVPVESGLLNGATNPNGGTLTAEPALLRVRGTQGTLGELWTLFGTGITTYYEGVWPNGYYYTLRPSQPVHGALNLSADGSFTYTPNPNFSGTDSFEFVVNDGLTTSLPITATFTINPAQDAPIARFDLYERIQFNLNNGFDAFYFVSADEAGGLLANDGDADGDTLTAILVTPPTHGTIVLSANGAFDYEVPYSNTAFDKFDEFTYKVNDGQSDSAAVRVQLGLAPIVALDDFYPFSGQVVNIAPGGVLANDTNPNAAAGVGISAFLRDPPDHGTVTLNYDGSFTYTPDSGSTQADSFTYVASSFLRFSQPARVKLGNTPPLAVDDSGYSSFNGGAISVSAAEGVLTGDSDPDGDPNLTVSLVNGPANGTLTLNADGSFTYTPDGGFSGVDSFVYSVNDGLTDSAGATVSINVVNPLSISSITPPPNSVDAPVDAEVVIAFDRPIIAESLNITVNGALTGDRSFTTSLNGGQVTLGFSSDFLPGELITVNMKAGVQGSGSTQLQNSVTWQFLAEVDRGGPYFTESVPSTVARNHQSAATGDLNGDGFVDAVVVSLNAAPVVLINNGDQTFTEAEELLGMTEIASSPMNPVLGDFDEDGDLDVVLRGRVPPSGGTFLIPAIRLGLNDGSGNFGTTIDLPQEAPNFAAPGDFDGDGHLDIFGLGVGTGGGTSDVWIWRGDGAGNFTVTSKINIVMASLSTGAVGDVDNDGDLDVMIVGDQGGQLLLNDGAGSLSAVEQDFVPDHSEDVALGDVDDDGDLDAVVGAVLGPSLVALNDGSGQFRAAQQLDVKNTVGVALGDLDGDRDLDIFLGNTGSMGIPAVANQIWVNDGLGRFQSTAQQIGSLPSSDVSLADLDNDGDLDAFVANHNFNGEGDSPNRVWLNESSPLAVDDFYPGNTTTIDAASGVTDNDLGGDGGTFTVVKDADPLHGSVILNGNGSFTYTPDGSPVPDVFTYHLEDSFQSSRIARVKIGNSAPVADDDFYFAVSGADLIISVLDGVTDDDADPEGDPLTAILASGPTNGVVTLNPDGSFIYRPIPGYSGPDSFTYYVNDGVTDSGVATVSLDVRLQLSIVSIQPAINALQVPQIADIVVAFDRPIDPGTIAGNVSIVGSESGPYAFAAGLNGDTLILDPELTFLPGERITVTLTRAMTGASGELLALPYLWEFTVEAPLGNGVFEDSGQRLGDDRSFGAVAMGDLDGDGDLDAFVGHAVKTGDGGVIIAGTAFDAVFFNTNGVFSRDTDIDAINNAQFSDEATFDIALGDVDNDGDLDAFVASSEHQLLFNNGDGSFVDSGEPFETNIDSAKMADVDGDNDLDLIFLIVRFRDFSISVWLNDGAGSFTANPLSTASLDFNSQLRLNDLLVRDLDNDGDMDILAQQSLFGPFKVWLNDGNAVFRESGNDFGTGTPSLSLSLGDVDGDGDLDAFMPSSGQSYLWFNQGDGSFVDSGLVYGDFNVDDAALADVDADGDLDAVVIQKFPSSSTTPHYNNSTILLNDGAGVFSATGLIIGDSTLTGDNPPQGQVQNSGLAMGDIDLDGDLDAYILIRDRTSARVGRPDQVWLNQSSIAPLSGLSAATVINDDDVTRPFSNVVILAPSGTNLAVQISLDAIAKGSFTPSSLTASGFSGPSGNSYSLAATSASLAQGAMRQLVFSPTANRVPVGSSEITAFTVVATTDDSSPVILTDNSTTVTSISVNDPPLAVDDSGPGFGTGDATAFTTANVLDNDTDPDPSENLVVISLDTTGTIGIVTNNGDGTFGYDPAGQFAALPQGQTATDAFTYTLEDNNGALASARVAIAISGQNQAPVALDDSVSVGERGVYVITQDVLMNDTDIDAGDQPNLSISAIDTSAATGTVQFDPANGLTYTPFGNLAAGASATDIFNYAIVDPQGQVSANFAGVTVTIIGQNDPPVANSDQITVLENATATDVSPALKSNDTDPDPGDTGTLVLAGVDPTNTRGEVVFANGTVTYRPGGAFDALADGETGSDRFGYTVRDARGETAQGSVIVAITGQNDPPVAGPDFPLVKDDQANVDLTAVLLANDSDVDNGETLSLAISTVDATAAAGTVSFAGGPVRYTPDPNLSLTGGETTTDTFTYTVTDRHGASATGQVTVVIIGVNTPPVADDDAYSAIEDTRLVAAAPGVLDGDTDAEGDTLSAALATTTGHGTLSLNADGSFSYDPGSNYCGPDSFTYRANDGREDSTKAATVTIDVACVNDAPGFTAGNPPTVNEDAGPQTAAVAGSFNAGPANESGQVVAAYIVSNVSNGGVLAAGPGVNNNGVLSYTPAGDAFGSVTFDLQVQDDGGTADNGVDTSAAQTVTITILAVNDAPVADNDAYNATEDTQLVIPAPGVPGVLDGDTDIDGDILSAVLDAAASHGTLSLNTEGSFSYTPNANYCGPDSFTYHATDGPAPRDGASLNSNVATVAITVACVNDAPVVTGVTPASQTVDYSDYVQTVTITAEDVDSTRLTLSQTGAPASLPDPTLAGTASCMTVGNDTIADGATCSWTLDGMVTDPAAVYNIDFTAYDRVDDSAAARHALTVQAEEATVWFDEDNPVSVQVAGPGGNSDGFSLFVSVVETLPDQPDNDLDDSGDIGKAVVSMQLVPVGPGSPVSGICVSEPVVGTAGYDTTLPVTCSFEDVPVNTYTVEATVYGDYFAGFGEDVLTIYDPSLGFVSGGGWFYWPGTEDLETGYPGDKTNFGVTMKYGKNGKNVKGNLLIMRHLPDDLKFRLKSNALAGLALGDSVDNDGPFGWASFSGKATFLSPDMEDPEGNHSFVVYVEDRDSPGDGTDLFWIEVRDKDDNVIFDLSLPRDAIDYSEPIQGGNIVALH